MFTTATLKFLDELAANNNRTWFDANKPRYESLVREPLRSTCRVRPIFEARPGIIYGELLHLLRNIMSNQSNCT
jgi:hypothetical protein